MISARLTALFDALWTDFTAINPQAEAIHKLLASRGERIINDHIAFRTFSDPRIGIDVIARPFIEEGYRTAEEYRFEEKKLFARHFEHPDPAAPRVFISELLLNEFETSLQNTIRGLIDQLTPAQLADPLLCSRGRLWTVAHETYLQLIRQSEYAGWTAAFGFRANHFTIFVNDLKSIHSLQELNELLKQEGFLLNSQGGEVKGSPEDFLEQSSTLASQIEVQFSDGPWRIPGCYYEFARRYHLPDGSLFQGFVAKSADKIFESTHRQPR